MVQNRLDRCRGENGVKHFEPPIFPPWHGKLSPLIDTRRRREIETARQAQVFLLHFVISGFLWVIIFTIFRWALM